MSGTTNDPNPAPPEGGDEREEWSAPRVILSEIRSTDKGYNLTDGSTTAS